MKDTRAIVLLCGLLLSIALRAEASIITNGSFEPLTPFGSYQLLPGGSAAIPGWSTTDDGVEWFKPADYGQSPPPTAGIGVYVLDLAVVSVGGIRQTFPTSPSQTYAVTFYVGTQQTLGRDGTAEVLVSVDGVSQTFSVVRTSASIGWRSCTLVFTADDATATLSFRCVQDQSLHFAYLDLVLVDALAAANIVANGSLEPTSAFGNYQLIPGGSAAIPGWTTTDTGVEWFRPASFANPLPPDGTYVVDLANPNSSAGGIMQVLSTVPGQEYAVTFFLGTHETSGSDGTAEVVVSADGISQTFATSHLNSVIGWQPFSFIFTADDAVATLSFRCLQDPSLHYAYLDQIGVGKLPRTHEIANGSFEPIVPFGDYDALPSGSSAIPGWTTTDSGVEWFWPGGYAAGSSVDGIYVVDLANLTYGAGGISQSMPTVAGQDYTVLFYGGTSQRDGRDGTAEIVASADGVSQTFAFDGHTSAITWQLCQFVFIADDAQATLSFRCLQNASVHFADLDQVSVYSGVTGVEPAVVPLGFGVTRVGPTPASGSVRVDYRIPADMAPQIEIVDVRGRVVARQQPIRLPAGDHQVRLSLQDIPPGVYFVVLRSRGQTAARKIAVVH